MRRTLPLPPLAALTMAALSAALPRPAGAAADPLAALRWRSRVVVALAPTRGDPALAAQRRLFSDLGAGAHDRDLVLVAATDDTPEGAALRQRFGGSGFVAVLVGKDGSEKMRSPAPLGRDALFPTIDAMPMRREEMTRRP